MRADATPSVAIVDYGLGNLYSVRHACAHVGLTAFVTSSAPEILAADIVILPGVGAYRDAMRTLDSLDLAAVLRDVAASPRLLVGICLGMQLLMTESEEFGRHKGLGILEGGVTRLPQGAAGEPMLKVPQVGWSGIHRPRASVEARDPWDGSLLAGTEDGEPMYFVHSYVARPQDADVLATSRYGAVEFSSAVRRGNVMACQFHPERSGPAGLHIYRNLATLLSAGSQERSRESVV